MKKQIICLSVLVLGFVASCSKSTGTDDAQVKGKLYLDVHNLAPGKVTAADVAAAHEKDLAAQGKYNVSFIRYWVDEAAGKVYCLADAPDSASVANTHRDAHGLLPDEVHPVKQGQ